MLKRRSSAFMLSGVRCLTLALNPRSLMRRWCGVNLPGVYGLSIWSNRIFARRTSRRPIFRSMGLLVVVSLLLNASSTNWKLAASSAFCLYRVALVPNSCALSILILFSNKGRISTFAARRATSSISVSCLSYNFMPSMMTRLNMPNFIRWISTLVSNFSARSPDTVPAAHRCMYGILLKASNIR